MAAGVAGAPAPAWTRSPGTAPLPRGDPAAGAVPASHPAHPPPRCQRPRVADAAGSSSAPGNDTAGGEGSGPSPGPHLPW